MALDLSYIIPIFLRRFFENHPEVQFKPGPFYMGSGLLGKVCNTTSILWTLFVCVIFSFPTYLPVTKDNMNYASVRFRPIHFQSPGVPALFQVITIGVLILSGLWWILGAHKYYHGPQSNLHEPTSAQDIAASSIDSEDSKNADVEVTEV
ncbi:hypothetical protein C0992_011449 [Termitomyces sp. T32_za158]|nr:hypothetical protein C0992_011449 [Termitomyces sp. T32_za158]